MRSNCLRVSILLASLLFERSGMVPIPGFSFPVGESIVYHRGKSLGFLWYDVQAFYGTINYCRLCSSAVSREVCLYARHNPPLCWIWTII
jgi:hypothetical protein